MSLGDFMLRVFIAVFSAGWLFPLWLSLRAMIAFVNTELLPAIRGVPPQNSFGYLFATGDAFTIACIWLALVILYWSWRLTAPKTAAARGGNKRG